MNHSPDPPGLAVPPESAILKDAYRRSGLTVADLAVATGLSVGTVHIAMDGFRHRDGVAKAVVPPDRTLVRLAAALRIRPDVLRAHGRERAAGLLEAVAAAEDAPPPAASPADAEAQVAPSAGRTALARQVLAAFSTEELHDELERRERAQHDAIHQQVTTELAEDLRTGQWPL